MGAIYAACLGMAARQNQFRMNVSHSVQQPLNLSFGLYIGVLCLGLFYSQDLREGISVLKQTINLPLAYLMVAVLLDAEPDREKRTLIAQRTLFAFLMGIFTLDLIAFLTYIGAIGDKQGILPVTPLKMHHIWFGNLNAIGFLGAATLIFFRSHRGKSFQAFVLLMFIPVALASLLLSMSRTAWVGFLGASVVLLYFLVPARKKFFFLSALFLTSCVSAYFISDAVHARIDRIFQDIDLFISGDPNTSLGARFTMWDASISMFLSNPLCGVGTGDYKSTISSFVASGHYPEILGKFNQPHNIYLFALATNGIIGLSALLFLFYRIMRHARIVLRQQNKAYGVLALTITTHFLVSGLTESLFNIHVLISSFALLMGICLRAANLRSIDK